MYKHVLLPFDGSELSHNAARETFKLAKSLGAAVTVLHVVSHGSLTVEEGLGSREVQRLKREYEAAASKAAEATLAGLAQEAQGMGIKCNAVVVVGDQPFQEIVDYAAREKCDLIMMASHGRRPLQSLLLGSETIKVLSHCKIPVLVVR